MLPVVWSVEALDALDEIIAYIEERNESASARLQALIRASAEKLPLHPYLHCPGRVANTREAVVHPNYIVVYRVAQDHILIVAVLHARQQYP